ncbi:MAG: hypothetical protein R3E31_05290 [Chloroflexota bacterium]|nr:hypothetical protein [Anaerolineales bacterium]
MFGGLQLPVFKVEMLMPGFIIRTEFQPKGDMLIFMNDRRYSVIHCDNVELYPIIPDAQVRCLKQEMMALTKNQIAGISVLEEERVENLQMMASKRPFIVYTEWYAIQGDLHTNPDARDDDVFDETRTFFAMTNAVVIPIRSVRKAPTKHVPFLAINQNRVLAYHPHHPKSE